MAGYFVRTDRGYVGQVTADGRVQTDLRPQFAYCYPTEHEAAAMGATCVRSGLAASWEVERG